MKINVSLTNQEYEYLKNRERCLRRSFSAGEKFAKEEGGIFFIGLGMVIGIVLSVILYFATL